MTFAKNLIKQTNVMLGYAAKIYHALLDIKITILNKKKKLNQKIYKKNYKKTKLHGISNMFKTLDSCANNFKVNIAEALIWSIK